MVLYWSLGWVSSILQVLRCPGPRVGMLLAYDAQVRGQCFLWSYLPESFAGITDRSHSAISPWTWPRLHSTASAAAQPASPRPASCGRPFAVSQLLACSSSPPLCTHYSWWSGWYNSTWKPRWLGKWNGRLSPWPNLHVSLATLISLRPPPDNCVELFARQSPLRVPGPGPQLLKVSFNLPCISLSWHSLFLASPTYVSSQRMSSARSCRFGTFPPSTSHFHLFL